MSDQRHQHRRQHRRHRRCSRRHDADDDVINDVTVSPRMTSRDAAGNIVTLLAIT